MTETRRTTRTDDATTDRRTATDRPEPDEPTIRDATGGTGTGTGTETETGAGTGTNTGEPTESKTGSGAPMTFSPTSSVRMGQFDTEARQDSR